VFELLYHPLACQLVLLVQLCLPEGMQFCIIYSRLLSWSVTTSWLRFVVSLLIIIALLIVFLRVANAPLNAVVVVEKSSIFLVSVTLVALIRIHVVTSFVFMYAGVVRDIIIAGTAVRTAVYLLLLCGVRFFIIVDNGVIGGWVSCIQIVVIWVCAILCRGVNGWRWIDSIIVVISGFPFGHIDMGKIISNWWLAFVGTK